MLSGLRRHDECDRRVCADVGLDEVEPDVPNSSTIAMRDIRAWPMPDRRARSAGLIALLVALATLVVVVLVSAVFVLVIFPGGDARARGELVGRGAAQLSLVVGLTTYAIVRLRRSRKGTDRTPR
jgi:hypothetical protein